MKALLHALNSPIPGIATGAAKAAPTHGTADLETLLLDGNSRVRHNVPGNPWSGAMLISYLLVLALLLLAGVASAANDWQLVGQDREELVFVDRAVATPAPGTLRAWVLKSSRNPATLGDDWYPHRSKKLLVEVRCDDRALRVSEWVFTEGALGHGRPVWADVSREDSWSAAPNGSAEALLAARICTDHVAILDENSPIIR